MPPPGDPAADTEGFALALPAVPASVGRARRPAGRLALALGADPELAADVELAVSEAVTNAVRHAYPAPHEPGEVHVAVTVTHTGLRIVVADDGVGLHGSDRRTGGLGRGLAIMEEVADELLVVSPGGATGTSVQLTFVVRAAS